MKNKTTKQTPNENPSDALLIELDNRHSLLTHAVDALLSFTRLTSDAYQSLLEEHGTQTTAQMAIEQYELECLVIENVTKASNALELALHPVVRPAFVRKPVNNLDEALTVLMGPSKKLRD